MSRRTVEQEQAAYDAMWGMSPLVIEPDDTCSFVTSAWDDCLTHVVRFVYLYEADPDARLPEWRVDRVTYKCQCGENFTSKARAIPPGQISGFVCHKCLEALGKYGIEPPVPNLIPDTGCAVSGGKRGLKLGKTYPAGHYTRRR